MTSPSRTKSGWRRHNQPSALFPRKKPAAIPKRTAELIERVVFRGESVAEASAAMGIKLGTGEQYWKHPKRKEYYRQLCEDMRDRTVPRNTLKAIEIRDRPLNSAADARAAVESMKFLEDRGQGGVVVNVNNTNVQQNMVAPGYLVSVPSDYADSALEILKKAGSTRNVTDAGDVEDVEPLPIAPPMAPVHGDRPAVPEKPQAYVSTASPEFKGPSEAEWERRRDGMLLPRERRRT